MGEPYALLFVASPPRVGRFARGRLKRPVESLPHFSIPERVFLQRAAILALPLPSFHSAASIPETDLALSLPLFPIPQN